MAITPEERARLRREFAAEMALAIRKRLGDLGGIECGCRNAELRAFISRLEDGAAQGMSAIDGRLILDAKRDALFAAAKVLSERGMDDAATAVRSMARGPGPA